MEDRWFCDLEPSARWPHYTRANAGEVLAPPASPLGQTFIWNNGTFLGWRDGYIRQGYFTDGEIIHLSKFSPSETYGWSPILTVFEKALTLIGMDKNLYRYFFERKMPSSMLMVTTDDPESLRRERDHIAAQTRVDPNYIPMIAVSSRTNRGRVLNFGRKYICFIPMF